MLDFTPAKGMIDKDRKAGVERGKAPLDAGCGSGRPVCLPYAGFSLDVTSLELLDQLRGSNQS